MNNTEHNYKEKIVLKIIMLIVYLYLKALKLRFNN